jgi:hypothetical protein
MYQDKLSLLNTSGKSGAKIPAQLTLFSHATTPSTSTHTAAIGELARTHERARAAPARDQRDPPRTTHVAPEHGARLRPRVHARVRPVRITATYAHARRRERNIALVRRLFASDELLAGGFAPFDDGVGFRAGPITPVALETFFAEPLPIGVDRAIPLGTGSSPSQGEERMNELDQLVDAIDAGATEVGRLSPQVAYFLRNSRAPSTRNLYRWAWNRALRSCAAMDRCAMPMSEATAAMVIVDGVNDGLAVGSLRIVAAVISVAHSLGKHVDPTQTEAFRSVMRGIGRVLTHRQDRKVALNPDELLRIREACDVDPNRARGTRDWALVAVGFAGAFRRSEIVARNHADLEFVGDELRVYLDRSKTDQFGRGAYVRIRSANNPKLCPLRALGAWTAIAPGPGPLFRAISKHGGVVHRRLSAGAVSLIVKGFGVVLDLPEDRLGAHSLRAGMVTALLEAGVGDIKTMEHSRHKSHDTLRKYYRPRTSGPNYTVMAGL